MNGAARVKVYRWAKRPRQVYLVFERTQDAVEVKEIHLGKPPKVWPNEYGVKTFWFFECEGETKTGALMMTKEDKPHV